MMPMSKADLEEYFDYDALKVGASLFRAGAVGEISSPVPGSFSALVRGKDGVLTFAAIDIDADEGLIEDCWCDCGIEYDCEHVTALAWALLAQSNVESGRKSAKADSATPDELDALARALRESQETAKPVKMAIAAGDLERMQAQTRQSFGRVTDQQDKAEQPWKPVLLCEVDRAGLNMELGMRFVKKDGSPGRIDKYRADKLPHPGGTVQKLVYLQSMEAYRYAPASVYLELLPALSSEGIPLVMPGGHDLVPATLERIVLGLKPAAASKGQSGKYRVSLSPQIGYAGRSFAGELLEGEESEDHALGLEFDYLWIKGPGVLLFRRLDARQLERAQLILGDVTGFVCLGEDEQERILEPMAGLFAIGSRNTSLELLSLVPQPLLQLSPGSGVVQADIQFVYRDRRIAPSVKGDVVTLADGLMAMRDRDFEHRAIRAVGDLFQKTFGKRIDFPQWANWYGSPMHCFTIGDKDMAAILLECGRPLLAAGFAVEVGMVPVRPARALKIQAAGLGSDWLKVRANVEIVPGEFVGIEALAASDAGLAMGLIKTRLGYVFLSPEDLATLEALRAAGLDDRDGDALDLPLADPEALDLVLKHLELAEAERQSLLRRREIIASLQDYRPAHSPALPPGFRGELRPYQVQGFAWLLEHQRLGLNCLLADDMGLGKTVQTLCLLAAMRHGGSFRRGLLLAPVVTLNNWQSEASRFYPDLNVQVYWGAARELGGLDESRACLLVCSYQTLIRDQAILADYDFDILILDEAQAVKNHRSKTFAAVKSIKAAFRLSLTGTPVENRLLELWAQLHLLEPDVLGPEAAFKRRFVGPVEKRRDSTRAAQLKRMIAPFILRRRKEEVLADLPAKTIILERIGLEPAQRRFYETLRAQLWAEVQEAFNADDPARGLIVMMAALLRLRQCCLVPALVHPDGEALPSAKLEFFGQFVEDLLAEDHKILVFSQFTSVLDVLRSRCDTLGIPWCLIQGDTVDRQGEIERFRRPDGPRVFFLSLKAGGVGINLVEADYVLIFDPWWNPAAEMQAIDRAHRIGQTRPVTVYKLIASDTVEEKILALQERKRELAESLIGEGQLAPGALSLEEAAELFS